VCDACLLHGLVSYMIWEFEEELVCDEEIDCAGLDQVLDDASDFGWHVEQSKRRLWSLRAAVNVS
jgi:hypothetical protein